MADTYAGEVFGALSWDSGFQTPHERGGFDFEIDGGPDFSDGGRFLVVGTCAVSGTPDVPVSRRVRLLCRVSGRLIREIWSTPAGDYAFHDVRKGPWTIISYDHTGEYNAVIADNILGTPM